MFQLMDSKDEHVWAHLLYRWCQWNLQFVLTFCASLARLGNEMWGSQWGAPHGWTMMDLGARSCIMIMTIVISIAVWMARYLEEFFGTGFLCLFPLQLWFVLCPCFQAGTIPRYTIVPCAGCEPEALPWMQAVCLKMWQLWDRRIWSLVTHDTTWHEHLLTLCPCAIWRRGKQHGCLFRLAMHFLSSVVLSLEFSECLGAGSRRSLRYHFYIRVPHQDKWRKTWHVWDPINHGIKKTIYQRVQDSSHQQCALLSLISHSSCRMLTAPFARAKLLQGRFLAMTLEITSWVARGEVLPQTYCQKACLLHSFVPQVPVFFSNLVVLSWNCSSTETSSLKKRQGFRVKCLFIPAKIPTWFLPLWILGVVTATLVPRTFRCTNLADLRPTWRVSKAQMMRWRARMWKSNRDALFASPADLCRLRGQKVLSGGFYITCKSWKKNVSISCWWYRLSFTQRFLKRMDPVKLFSPVEMRKWDNSCQGSQIGGAFGGSPLSLWTSSPFCGELSWPRGTAYRVLKDIFQLAEPTIEALLGGGPFRHFSRFQFYLAWSLGSYKTRIFPLFLTLKIEYKSQVTQGFSHVTLGIWFADRKYATKD